MSDAYRDPAYRDPAYRDSAERGPAERGPAERLHHAQLLQRIGQQADRAAFGELFAHFAPRLKGFLIHAGASPEQADDLSQEAMLLVWRKAAQFDASKAGAATWIYTIARNLRIDAARRRVIQTVADDSSDVMAGGRDDADDGANGAEMSAETRAAAQQRADHVQRALGELPDEQSRVILMAFYHGKAHADVARELDLPLGTVKSRLRLAAQKLRTLLGEWSE
ncbi:sigma-70 family RNA polymerase sigma factor [Robbsia sp. Bb-Pol-6]|uniref:Sigma-70 family RNA polymerase sigma factor n=1 Tax=Robbsia betulipollinis TaxID=2981849 RepID=A0ABT3ZHF2_9BURK|nr:sigma-70 family RNA polymerase sigma factor [Robbsia betulipollinis]MCY0385956.1 sigma-70 family RNA polymerase sigma factor [Robbsia betulipollinis]